MSRAAVDNAADAGQIRDAKRKEKLEADQARDDLVGLGEDPRFARYLFRRIESCNVFHTSFDRDTGVMALNEGQRNVGLVLMADLQTANPTALVDLLRARALKETT